VAQRELLCWVEDEKTTKGSATKIIQVYNYDVSFPFQNFSLSQRLENEPGGHSTTEHIPSYKFLNAMCLVKGAPV
jgi:hypothetical protein